MIKKINHIIEIEQDQVVSIICDVCKTEYTMEDTFEVQEFFGIYRSCGYGSIFGDMNKIKVDVCQHCMKKILEENIKNLNEFIIEEE